MNTSQESASICVHLGTGFYFLLSIKTWETESNERALRQACAFAIMLNLSFDYIKDGSRKMEEFIAFCKNDNHPEDPRNDMSEEGIMEYMNYIYLDLSEYNQPNIWVNMTNTRIDTTVYDNTVIM